jgi:hypothetical protein
LAPVQAANYAQGVAAFTTPVGQLIVVFVSGTRYGINQVLLPPNFAT